MSKIGALSMVVTIFVIWLFYSIRFIKSLIQKNKEREERKWDELYHKREEQAKRELRKQKYGDYIDAEGKEVHKYLK